MSAATPPPSPPSPISTDASSNLLPEDAVHIQGVPLQTAYPRSAGTVRVPVLFEIDVPQLTVEDRPAFELCIVLDRSGSMAGTKMRAASSAVHSAINALANGDILHLVAYSDEVVTVFTRGTRANARELHAAVADISAGGQTNISAALTRAQELLINSGEGGGSKRIFLLSDGHPSTGTVSPNGLRELAQEVREGGMVISTFGIGADIDEEMMKGIATVGRGSYFFLRQTIIRQTIEGAMSTLCRTIGREAVIHVHSLPPVGRLMSIHRPLDDFSAEDRDEQQTRSEQETNASVGAHGAGAVWIGDLTSGSRKQSLIEATLSVPQSALEGGLEMLRYELVYQCTSSHREIRIPGVVAVCIGDDGTRVPSVFVADELQQLEPRQLEFRQFLQDGQRSEALALQHSIIEVLEGLEADDEQGYVAANLRRLRRVVERLQDGVISDVQAGLMVGEALERQAEGDILQTSSFASYAGTADTTSWGPAPRSLTSEHSRGSRRSSVGSGSRRTTSLPMQRHARDSRMRRVLRVCFPCFRRPEVGEMLIPRTNTDDFIERRTQSELSFQRDADDASDTDSIIAPVPMRPPAFLLRPGFDVASLPCEFLCPIMHEPMTDPVVVQDGHTYERTAITRWLAQGARTSPKTGAPMPGRLLIPNHALRAQIMTENDRLAALASPAE